MKYKIILFTIAVGLFTACSDFLDREPFGSLSETSFYQTKQHAEYAANSCYPPLQQLNGFWATGTLIFGNLCSDDCTQSGSVDASYVRGNFDPGDNYLVKGSFLNAYSGIARCNIGIQKVGAMPANLIDDADKNQLIGEMRFIRAYWYFRLVRLYGDVPIILEPVDMTNQEMLNPKRSAVNEVYEKAIIPDLQFAADNLKETYSSAGDLPRATSGAAHAFLLAVHLNRGNYDEAIKEGEKVVSSGVYQLLEDMPSIYMETNEYNKESIFEASFSKDNQNWTSRYYGTVDGGMCRGEIYTTHFNPTTNLRDAFSLIDGSSITGDPNKLYDAANFWKNRDPRFDISFYTPLDTNTHKSTGGQLVYSMGWVLNKDGGVDFQKNTLWYGPDNTNVGLNNILMRYAEVLLNLSEAYIQKGDYGNGAKYINEVRARARNYALANPGKYNPDNLPEGQILPDISISGKEDGMFKLRYERRVEFAGENVRGFDLRRWGIEADTWAKVQGFDWNDKIKLLPIPLTEMNINPNLMPQNPGY